MVHIVGAGIGDAGLVTMKALKCVKEAQVILYDALVSPEILSYANEKCRLIYTGKRAGKHSYTQDEINALLVRYGKEYETVRLKGGDPFVFGRGSEETAELVRNGIEYEVVPGISSAYAAAEYAGIPVTHRGIASSFHVITGHESGSGEPADYALLAKLSGTLVFLMGLGSAEEITRQLIENGKDMDTPAAIISNASTPKQRIVTGALKELSELAKRAETPAVIIVGSTVGLKNEWFRPAGARIIATGTRAFNAKIKKTLQPLQVMEIPLIRTEEINADIFAGLDFNSFSHIAFTSSVGVDLFFKRLADNRMDIRCLGNIRFAVTGRGTAAALAERGIFADIIPDEYNVRALSKMLLDCGRVLVIRAENGSDIISHTLGARAYDMPLYRTEADHSKKELLNYCVPQADYVILASGSAARAYALMRESGTKAKIVAIGRETALEAKKHGISVYKTAARADADGIAKCILEAHL